MGARYVVTGALVQVRANDANGNEALVYLYQGSPLPAGVNEATLAHLVGVNLIAKVDGPDVVDDVDGDGPIPAKSAAKPDWVAYAVAQGSDQADAEAATKDDLIATYGN